MDYISILRSSWLYSCCNIEILSESMKYVWEDVALFYQQNQIKWFLIWENSNQDTSVLKNIKMDQSVKPLPDLADESLLLNEI